MGPQAGHAGVKEDVSTHVKALLVLGAFAWILGWSLCKEILCSLQGSVQDLHTGFVHETATLNTKAKACDAVAQYQTLLLGFVL